MIIAVVRRPADFRLSLKTALTIGMKKQSDFPDPVPVVTT
jgi:hypothetical protein